jgi:hypothetical protein
MIFLTPSCDIPDLDTFSSGIRLLSAGIFAFPFQHLFVPDELDNFNIRVHAPNFACNEALTVCFERTQVGL